MMFRKIKFSVSVLTFLLLMAEVNSQVGIPAGIHYQAVARDSYGKELSSADIDVRFSVISQNPLGTVVYQELHSEVITSKYGVFSLIIGQGVPTGGLYSNLSQVQWADSYHYLKVEVKFENNFVDMGTMQFMAVPYALFASKSLEPGPSGAPGPKGETGSQGLPGPKGDQGDPATDDQTLSVVNVEGSDYLAISGGNQVKISNIERDGDPANEIQDLTINSDKLKITNNTNATEWDLSPYRQSLTYDPATRIIGITGTSSSMNLTELKNDDDASPTNEIQAISFDPGTKILSLTNSVSADLSSLEDDADANPANEIQSLSIASDNLSISGSNTVSLTPYKDNTDSQTLTLASDVLSISGGNSVNLSGYKDNTDSQTLSYNSSTNVITLTNGGSINLGSPVAFRAKKTVSETGLTIGTEYDFILGTEVYDDGSGYNPTSGIFTAPSSGIYIFNIAYTASGSGDGRELKLYHEGALYEIISSGITGGLSFSHAITMKLIQGEEVYITIKTGLSTESGTGSFSGFRVY
ncbi:MAG: hypothetical protein IPN68_08880 [Bacteroidetes bacterium]|nr:hypothetical protein [Bacteroidota bacterium]